VHPQPAPVLCRELAGRWQHAAVAAAAGMVAVAGGCVGDTPALGVDVWVTGAAGAAAAALWDGD
jgi:hypothetical protein